MDVLVSIAHFESRESGLIFLDPIERALADLGYSERSGVGIMIEGWPVQFLPAASELDEEALDRAVELDIGLTVDAPVKARCLRAEYVVATAVKLGRLKDLARVQAFLQQGG